MNEGCDLTFSRALAIRAAPAAEDEALLNLARSRALDAAVFDQYPPLFFPGEISSSRWDAYATRMGTSSLRNYAAEAAEGVAFLRGHDSMSDPIGHTLTGRFVGGGGDGVARVEADLYALPLEDAAGFIARLRAGVVRDLSIGFYGGEWVCSLCARDMTQWMSRDGCPHLLGVLYTPADEAGQPQGKPQLARATIEDAHLAEVSGVYDGATPGAMIAKARALSAEGLLTDGQRELVSVRYRIPLAASARAFRGVTLDTRDTPSFADWPIYPERDAAWDTDAANTSLRAWASQDGSGDKDQIDWGKLRSGYFWFEADAENFESLKLPFCRVRGGKVLAEWGGIHRAANIMQGGRGGVDMPEADRDPVKRHIARYYAKCAKAFKDDAIVPPWEARATPESEVVPGTGRDERKEQDMDETTREALRARFRPLGLPDGEAEPDAWAERTLTDLRAERSRTQGVLAELAPPEGEADPHAWRVTEVRRLRSLADDGRAYREDLVSAALAEGVRACGDGFARETYEGILRTAPLEAVKRMRDDWQAAGDRLFAGGRITQDGPGEEKAEGESRFPAAAYAA